LLTRAYLGCILSDLNIINTTDSNSNEKTSDQAIEQYQSVDEVRKEDLECLKNQKKSKLTNIDYETYIRQFWVGLLEADGTINVSSPSANQAKVRIAISIKNLKENVLMLLLIRDVLGGITKIERKAGYVT
jgi:hypothetical protein